MFEAVLFDLDGTLLDIDMEFFLTKYFHEIAQMAVLSGCSDHKRLINQILSSTEVMIRDTNPKTRNEETFMKDFIKHLEADEMQMRDFFDNFYNTGFPRLQQYCKPFGGVPEMMADIFRTGIKVVIATNSVFPYQAIQTRLNWAGIGEFPYELITCYENMHYCKPNIHYYQEIIENIGIEPSACLMVGNDVSEDMVAGEIGIKTFLVEDRLIDKGNSYMPDWRGSLQEFFQFMENINRNYF
jgi:HAD superfamily hydrolase (TIGR01549 family)